MVKGTESQKGGRTMICEKCIYRDTCLLYKQEKEREEKVICDCAFPVFGEYFFGCSEFKGVYKNDD